MVDKSFDRYILIPPIHVCPLSIPNPPFIFWMHVHLRPLILINFTKKKWFFGGFMKTSCVLGTLTVVADLILLYFLFQWGTPIRLI